MPGIIDNLIINTNGGSQEWQSTSNPCMFMTCYQSHFFSVEMRYDMGRFEYVFTEWDENGEIAPSSRVFQNPEYAPQIEELFGAVIGSNDQFKDKVASIVELWKDNRQRETLAVDLSVIMARLASSNRDKQSPYRFKDNPSLYYEQNGNPYYVEPPFIQLETYVDEGYTSLQQARIILISAPGATGKSALSTYMSYSLGIPIFDLGKHKEVGAHSLVGLLVDNLDTDEYTRFVNGLKNGRESMIIDGLDEGEIKVNKAAFESFLDDTIKIAKGASGTPFIMLGRSRTVDDVIYYLESKEVPVACLQIEPFTIDKASEFIDKSMFSQGNAQRFIEPYKNVQKYIIDSIQGFFANDGELVYQAYNRFIGYAPVLMAITSLLKERCDYNKLLNEFLEEQRSNIDLVINIIEKILLREREKIRIQVLDQLLVHYDNSFKGVVLEKAASIEEQCARVLCAILGINYDEFSSPLTNNPEFNNKYKIQMDRWILNHPFINAINSSKIEFQNIVFESYVVALLAKNNKLVPTVVSYLQQSKSNSYLLFDFYYKLVDTSRKIDYQILPFIFDSFRALDSLGAGSSMEMISMTEEADFLEVECLLTFSRIGLDPEIEFYTVIPYYGTIVLPSSLCGISLYVPVDVCCRSPHLEIRPPLSIKCKGFSIQSRDIVISAPKTGDDDALIECEHFMASSEEGLLPAVYNRSGRSILKIRTKSQLSYPFNEYWVQPIEDVIDDKALLERYNKLRRTIRLFRLTDTLSRHKDFINCRICGSPIGKAVVDKLVASGIIVPDGIMYFLNTKALDAQLGLSYDSIHFGELNEQVCRFLSDV